MEKPEAGASASSGIEAEQRDPIPFTCLDGTQVLITFPSKLVWSSGCAVSDAKRCIRALAETFERERMAAAPNQAPTGEIPVDAVFRSWAYDS